MFTNIYQVYQGSFYVVDINIQALYQLKLFLLHWNLIPFFHICCWSNTFYIDSRFSDGTIFFATNIYYILLKLLMIYNYETPNLFATCLFACLRIDLTWLRSLPFFTSPYTSWIINHKWKKFKNISNKTKFVYISF